MDSSKLNELKLTAAKIRRHVIESVAAANSGHPGGSLSATDIITVLFFDEMKIDSKNPSWADRDRFVLSKGHAAPAYYAALAIKGFFPEEDLVTLRKTDSYLEGHPSMRKVPGCDMSTGSLGQGISCAVGMALAGRIDKKDYRVFSILGDGELEEGQVWEAAMAAAHYGLDNLVAFVDHNNLQIDGNIADVMNPNPVADKFAAFGWNVISIDGHDLEQIKGAIESAKTVKGKPTMVVCETVKGKGVSFMENDYGWHGVAPNAEQTEKALAEIDAYIKGLEA
ncbi:MAG: transketolase [Ruminococcaceae bacterium]|nr:transketolase [Oscillospiraceae bacterium]